MIDSEQFRAALSDVRKKIDTIDGEILNLLSQRAQCALEVGKIKAQYTEEAVYYRPEREADVLRRIHQLNAGPLSNGSLTHIYREIMSGCLGLESTIRVAYLGPFGSFSGTATREHFGHSAELVAATSIDDAFRQLEVKQVDYAIVPVENTTGGAVGRTLDLLIGTSAIICGEIKLRIHQNLLTLESSLSDVKKVFSHTQSLSQCHNWLNQNLPHAERVPVESNSLAAEMANEERFVAAIAGVSAAEQYQLPIIAKNIEDDPNNTTRFFILGRQLTEPTGKDLTSIVVSAPNRPGALHHLIQPLAEANISMTRLESRPDRNQTWQYVYFIDFEGHQNTPKIEEALASLQSRCSFYKILGSYPIATETD